jgi:hypothetical protein
MHVHIVQASGQLLLLLRRQLSGAVDRAGQIVAQRHHDTRVLADFGRSMDVRCCDLAGKPEKVTSKVISCVAVSSDTVAAPEPVDVLGGTSAAAVSVALNFTVAADAVPANRTAMLAIANERRSMEPPLLYHTDVILSSRNPPGFIRSRHFQTEMGKPRFPQSSIVAMLCLETNDMYRFMRACPRRSVREP